MGSEMCIRDSRDPAQGRRADGGEPARAGLLDHARDRRHRGQGGLRGADGDQYPAPLGGDVYGAAGIGAAERRRPDIAGPARAARRDRHHLSPFNFPLILSSRAVAPALATGNAVVLKPDPRTALTGGFIIARLFEEAGLPKGVLQVLPGGAEAGEAICICLLYTSPSPRDGLLSRMPSSA